MIKLSQIASEIREAFKAGNHARKKESVQDTVESGPVNLKGAVYTWCMNTKAAIRKLNADKILPYEIDDFYLPEAVWDDLELTGSFDSEEYIYMDGRGLNHGLHGSVGIQIQVLPDKNGIEIHFYTSRYFGYINPIQLSIQDLIGDKGSETVMEKLDLCWNKMFKLSK